MLNRARLTGVGMREERGFSSSDLGRVPWEQCHSAQLAEEKPGEGLGGEYSFFRDQTESQASILGRRPGQRTEAQAPGSWTQRFQVPYLVP